MQSAEGGAWIHGQVRHIQRVQQVDDDVTAPRGGLARLRQPTGALDIDGHGALDIDGHVALTIGTGPEAAASTAMNRSAAVRQDGSSASSGRWAIEARTTFRARRPSNPAQQPAS